MKEFLLRTRYRNFFISCLFFYALAPLIIYYGFAISILPEPAISGMINYLWLYHIGLCAFVSVMPSIVTTLVLAMLKEESKRKFNTTQKVMFNIMVLILAPLILLSRELKVFS